MLLLSACSSTSAPSGQSTSHPATPTAALAPNHASVRADSQGGCPTSHPVKLLTSGAYVDNTTTRHPHDAEIVAQRCYRSVDALRADHPQAFPATTLPDGSAIYCSSSQARTAMSVLRPEALQANDLVQLVLSTPRIGLSPVIARLQDLRRTVDDTSVPWCGTRAQQNLKNTLDATINGALAFLQQDDVTANADFSQAMSLVKDYGTEQQWLVEIANGQPITLPTPTPAR